MAKFRARNQGSASIRKPTCIIKNIPLNIADVDSAAEILVVVNLLLGNGMCEVSQLF